MNENGRVMTDIDDLQSGIISPRKEDTSNSLQDSSPPSNLGCALVRDEHQFFIQNKSRCIFVRDLPFHFRDTHLRQLIVSLARGGDSSVQQCRVKYSTPYNNQSSEFRLTKTLQVGFVMLRTPQHAQEVIQKLNASPRYCGRDLRASSFDSKAIMEASQDGSIHYTFKSSKLTTQVTEEIVREHFEGKFGAVKTISIRAHFWKSDHQEGYGFLDFVSPDAIGEIYENGGTEIGSVIYSFNKTINRQSRRGRVLVQSGENVVVDHGGNIESPKGRGNSRKSQNHRKPNRVEESHISEYSGVQHPQCHMQSMNSFQSNDARSVLPEHIHAYDAFPTVGAPMSLLQLRTRPGFQLVAVPIVDHSDFSGYASSPIYDSRHRMDVPPPMFHHNQPYAQIMQAPYAPYDAPPAQLQAPHTMYMQQPQQEFFPPPGQMASEQFSRINYATLPSPHFYRGPFEGMIQTNANVNMFPMQGSFDAGFSNSMHNNSNRINSTDVADGFSYDKKSNCSLTRDN